MTQHNKSVVMRVAVCLLSLLLLLPLSACSVSSGGDVESFLRAPQLSGQASAVQRALNSYLGSTAALKYPSSGDFLSPFVFGDWDGDGAQEAAALYVGEGSGSNVWLAILETTESGSWHVTQTVEGLSSEVVSVACAHLTDAESQQVIVGYGSAQGDRYVAVYRYRDDTLQTIIKQNYSDMILADITGHSNTEDLILSLPTETENAGVTLQLLTYVDGDFHSAQTLAVGAGNYTGCAALHAGMGANNRPYLVVDGKVGSNALASSVIMYEEKTGFLQTYTPEGISSLYNATLRNDVNLLSRDLNDDNAIDIPTIITDGGTIAAPVDKRLQFLLWKDYTQEDGASPIFGVYDSEARFFLRLPESMHGSIQLRGNATGTGWLICNADSTTIYCELRVVDPSTTENNTDYQRMANIGNQQLQARIVTHYYGLSLDDIAAGITLLD